MPPPDDAVLESVSVPSAPSTRVASGEASGSASVPVAASAPGDGCTTGDGTGSGATAVCVAAVTLHAVGRMHGALHEL